MRAVRELMLHGDSAVVFCFAKYWVRDEAGLVPGTNSD